MKVVLEDYIRGKYLKGIMVRVDRTTGQILLQIDKHGTRGDFVYLTAEQARELVKTLEEAINFLSGERHG